jgi:hypothetical protein
MPITIKFKSHAEQVKHTHTPTHTHTHARVHYYLPNGEAWLNFARLTHPAQGRPAQSKGVMGIEEATTRPGQRLSFVSQKHSSLSQKEGMVP